MNPWRLFFSFLCFSTNIYAQEQLAVRLNEQGILKIMEMTLKYNTATAEKRTVVIPQNIYKFTLPKATLNSNPIVRVVSEISNLNLNKNLDFYLHTSDIKITGEVDQQSLKTIIFNSHDNGFDVQLSLTLPQVMVTSSKLTLCADKKSEFECGKGLAASLTNVSVVNKGAPVKVKAILRLRNDNNIARLRVMSVETNLEGEGAPKLDIKYNSLTMPKAFIVVNKKPTELDTSGVKAELRRRTGFLAAKLLSFVADFVTSDLAEMMNVYLVNKQVATTWKLQPKDNDKQFMEYLKDPDMSYFYYGKDKPQVMKSSDPMELMMGQIADVLNNAQIELSLKKISTPGNKDIELAGILSFILNKDTIYVKDSLGNNPLNRMPRLDLNNERNSDLNLAISEPLINGALDLVNSTGLYQKIFEKFANVKGFSVQNVKVHFTKGSNMYAVVNARVDLKQLESSGVKKWLKNKIAAFLERNNNNAVIYFPIQVEFIPSFISLATGGVGIVLYVKSPFADNKLINTFNYPSNTEAMYESVRQGVMDELKTSLNQHTNKSYPIDLSKFLNQGGVEFLPRKISVNQGGYLLLNLDIVDIKFNSKKPLL